MGKILEIKGLSAGYGALRVIHDLDLIIEAGERVGIVGLNTLAKRINLSGWKTNR
jgi:branched-chain amino acid transport system ATP-binding protein